MRKLLIITLLSLSLILTGCSLFKNTVVTEEKSQETDYKSNENLPFQSIEELESQNTGEQVLPSDMPANFSGDVENTTGQDSASKDSILNTGIDNKDSANEETQPKINQNTGDIIPQKNTTTSTNNTKKTTTTTTTTNKTTTNNTTKSTTATDSKTTTTTTSVPKTDAVTENTNYSSTSESQEVNKTLQLIFDDNSSAEDLGVQSTGAVSKSATSNTGSATKTVVSTGTTDGELNNTMELLLGN